MASITTYHIGGYVQASPQQNRKSLADSASGLFTAWDTAGVQTVQRPLTADEAALLAAQDLATAKDSGVSALRAKAQQALATNGTYLGHAALPAGAALTTTQLTTAVRLLVAQVDALTKQNNALIRLALGLTDDVSDT